MTLTSAFVLDDETILCRYTPEGWWPVQVAIPQEPQDSITDDNCGHQPYELGCVTLLASVAIPSLHSKVAPDLELSSLVSVERACDNEVQATHAVTSHYANTHGIALPVITTELAVDDMITVNSVALISYRQLLTQLPVTVASQLSQAIQLLRWQADTQFCSRCGVSVTAAKHGERAMVCHTCHLRQYPRVQPCVITAITRPNPLTGEMQILLAHHHRYGRQTAPLQYGLIAGFVEVGESLEHAVVREVAEEVNIRLTDIRYVSSQPWPFPSNLMLGFRATYLSGDIVLQEDELSHADFFDISNLPKIPFKGSIAYHLIERIVHEQGMSLD